MPLQIELKPGEKVFINGAVIANGDHRAHFSILNDVALLRERDILTEESADTLCKRVYLLVQLMYMDTENSGNYLQTYVQHAEQVLQTVPESKDLIEAMNETLLNGKLYPAMKIAKKLIELEKDCTAYATKSAKRLSGS